ncbi:unnamed protein product [Rhodiola kirilowii]
MKAQVRPMRLEYVLGFLISFLQTIIRISLVMTVASGFTFDTPPPPSSTMFSKLNSSFSVCSTSKLLLSLCPATATQISVYCSSFLSLEHPAPFQQPLENENPRNRNQPQIDPDGVKAKTCTRISKASE